MSKLLLDFYSSTCSPCKMLSPIIDEFAKNNLDIEVRKINVEEEPQLARQYSVRSLPTVIMIQDDVVVASFVGLRDLKSIQELAENSFQ